MGNGTFRSQYDESITGSFSCDVSIPRLLEGKAKMYSCRIVTSNRSEVISITLLKENNRIIGRKTYLSAHASLLFSLQYRPATCECRSVLWGSERSQRTKEAGESGMWFGSYIQMDPPDVGSILINP